MGLRAHPRAPPPQVPRLGPRGAELRREVRAEGDRFSVARARGTARCSMEPRARAAVRPWDNVQVGRLFASMKKGRRFGTSGSFGDLTKHLSAPRIIPSDGKVRLFKQGTWREKNCLKPTPR